MHLIPREGMPIVLVVVLILPILVTAQSIKEKTPGSIPEALHTLMTSAPADQSSLVTVTQQTDLTGGTLAASVHEKFATFLAGEDFKSTLLLENFRPDQPITFAPTLILSHAEVPLDSVTVPAHSTASLDINTALKTRGYTDKRGTVAVRYQFKSYGAASTVVEMRDEKHHLYLNSYGQSPEEYWSGTTYDAVVWAPEEGTNGFVSVMNSSDETHAVEVTFLLNGQAPQRVKVQLSPRQTRSLSIDDLVAKSRESGAGIHIEYTQESGEKYPGAILVEGQLFNRRTGFAKHIHFSDKSLQFSTSTLRTNFVMLGNQPAEDNFPSNISFRSVAVVRNIDSVAVTVTPTVRFLRNGSLQMLPLPSRQLAPSESSVIDLSREQEAGRIPLDFNQGNLELMPNTDHTSIVGELFNFSSTGGYVVGPSFTSYPARSTSSIWRTDGSFQTTVMIENTAEQADRVSLRLYSDRGTYKKTFEVPAGNLIKINVRDLQQIGVPDDDGKLLLGTSGVLSLIGSHGTQSKLAYDKIIHDSNQSDYVGYPPNPCDFITDISLFLDLSGQPSAVMKQDDWSQSGPDVYAANSSFTSNSSLAQISNNGAGDMVTFTPPNDGQEHLVSIYPASPQDLVQNCVACSYGDVNVLAVSVRISIAFTKVKTTSDPGTGFCPSTAICSNTSTPKCTVATVFEGAPPCHPAHDCEFLAVKTGSNGSGTATCFINVCIGNFNTSPSSQCTPN